MFAQRFGERIARREIVAVVERAVASAQRKVIGHRDLGKRHGLQLLCQRCGKTKLRRIIANRVIRDSKDMTVPACARGVDHRRRNYRSQVYASGDVAAIMRKRVGSVFGSQCLESRQSRAAAVGLTAQVTHDRNEHRLLVGHLVIEPEHVGIEWLVIVVRINSDVLLRSAGNLSGRKIKLGDIGCNRIDAARWNHGARKGRSCIAAVGILKGSEWIVDGDNRPAGAGDKCARKIAGSFKSRRRSQGVTCRPVVPIDVLRIGEEGSVSPIVYFGNAERAIQLDARFVHAEGCVRGAGCVRLEGVGIQCRVTHQPANRTVVLISAALDGKADHAAACAA